MASTRELITSSLRTGLQLVPLAGGALAQAWSEYETSQKNARVEEFFHMLQARLRTCEASVETLRDRIGQMPDASRLLEDSVSAVCREAEAAKRALFPVFFVNVIARSDQISPAERAYLLESLDSLTLADLGTLRKFQATGQSRGDVLTDTSMEVFTQSQVEQGIAFENRLGSTMTSTSKLEARGIIANMQSDGAFHWSGPQGSWFNIYRQRAWCLMPIGRKLLETLQFDS